MAFSDRTIEEIKSKLSIVDVVSSYTQVLQRNNGFWIRCPFHGGGNERTPSCKLNLERGSFYCFACQEHGSMFDFVMKMEKVTFPEAVRTLATRAGVVLENETELDVKKKEIKNSLFALNEEMAKTFHDFLMTGQEAQDARDYIARRKITQDTVEKFNLGYAPRDPKWLYSHLKKQGYSDEFLQESGFFSKKSFPYPLFCNRLMFPVKNWQGRVIAFGARDLTFRDDTPKYINTPETSVYSKKHNLYGFYEALETIRTEHRAIVCEGNFDAISLHQAGITCAVAPFGTAFTSEHAKILRRLNVPLRLCLDGDDAGQHGILLMTKILDEYHISYQIVDYHGDKRDPDDIFNQDGKEKFVTLVSKLIKKNDFLINYFIRNKRPVSDKFYSLFRFSAACNWEVVRVNKRTFMFPAVQVVACFFNCRKSKTGCFYII